MTKTVQKSKARDMTQGSIWKQLLLFSLPLMAGNLFQQLYNTADSIDREQLPHLFDRFYRTDKSRSSRTGGYGLGLSIAAAVVNAHKGKITATTQDEHSLLITVMLPLKTQGR